MSEKPIYLNNIQNIYNMALIEVINDFCKNIETFADI